MKQRLKFFKEYLKNPSNTGSITPSSKFLKKQMISYIDFSKDFILVEYGPGNGIFSFDVISKKSPSSIVILIDNNLSFVNSLKDKFSSYDNVFIFHDSIENISFILNSINISQVDYIMSSIPFLSLGEDFTNRVLSASIPFLNSSGSFFLFQYTTYLYPLLKNHFKFVSKKFIIHNIPPAFVFYCSN